jgi:hypothetical protein
LVVMPALHLASLDRESGSIGPEQQAKMRDALVQVVSDLGNEPRRLSRGRSSVLDDTNPGLLLRQHREQLLGRWQGPIVVPPGSILLCVGLGTRADTIAAELLVRALREQHLDGRHVLIDDLENPERPPDAKPESIGVVYLVSAFPSAERDKSQRTIERLQQRFPAARVVPVFLPGVLLPADLPSEAAVAENGVSSFEAAVNLCLGSQSPAVPAGSPEGPSAPGATA